LPENRYSTSHVYFSVQRMSNVGLFILEFLIFAGRGRGAIRISLPGEGCRLPMSNIKSGVSIADNCCRPGNVVDPLRPRLKLHNLRCRLTIFRWPVKIFDKTARAQYLFAQTDKPRTVRHEVYGHLRPSMVNEAVIRQRQYNL
jgi:hypothetical protein